MFDTVEKRFALRCTLVGVSALLVSLQASSADALTSGEILQAVIAGALAGLGYAGIGAASKSVEPSIGNKSY